MIIYLVPFKKKHLRYDLRFGIFIESIFDVETRGQSHLTSHKLHGKLPLMF